MKKIKIIKSRPLKEEEEVIDQQDQKVVEKQPEITYESNPLEFMLMKYPTLTKTLTKLLTEDFRDYIIGVYIMAPKPTIFKIVLHNNRSFHLIYMGDDKYEAKVSGKKYWLDNVGEFENAVMSISDLLMLGTPPTTQGPETEMASAPEEETPEAEEVGGEEEAPEELAEGIIKEDAEATKKELKKAGYKDEDIVITGKSKIKLLTPAKERISTTTNLNKKLGYTWDKDYKGSSIGAVIDDKNDTVILIKPKERQGGGSAGLGNESFLANKINSTVEEVGGPITVVIKSKGKTMKYPKVTSAQEVGRDTSGYKKSDIKLLSGEKTVGNLSLKQENASMWESADKRYKDLMTKLVNKLTTKPYKNLGLAKTDKKGIYRLYNPSTKEEYSGIIITGLDKNDMASICFGTDDPRTVVVKETFDDSDFSLSGNTLTVTVHGLLTDLKDIEGTNYEPVLVVRHDSTRTATAGLRPIVYTRESVYKGDKVAGNRIELPYNKI